MLLTIAFWLFLMLSGLVIAFAHLLSIVVPTDFSHSEQMSVFTLMARACCLALIKRQGRYNVTDGQTYEEKIHSRDCRITKSALTQYLQVCQFSGPCHVPVCYPEVLCYPLLLSLVTQRFFPLSPFGLIHTRQVIKQHCDIQHLLKETFDLECSVDTFRHMTKGIEVDITVKVYDCRQLCVWESIMTLLSRDSSFINKKLPGKSQQTNEFGYDDRVWESRPPIVTRCDTGVHYAHVSGDWSVHHLWPVTAKVMGYKQPIAHGMWTLQTCLFNLSLHRSEAFLGPLKVDVTFKKPFFMPGSACVSAQKQPNQNQQLFKVHQSSLSETPHLLGLITYGSSQ